MSSHSNYKTPNCRARRLGQGGWKRRRKEFGKNVSDGKESVSLSAPSPTAFSFHLAKGKNCAKINRQSAQTQPRVQPDIPSHVSSAMQRVADPSNSPWPGKEQPRHTLEMDKERFHLPYSLGQAVQ